MGAGVPELVIFDCDGVLVDSEVISNDVLASALTAAELPTTLEQARAEYQGLLLADVATRAERRLGAALPGDFLERYERERDERLRRGLRPMVGAAEAVFGCRAAGVPVCVASQGKLEKTELTLGVTGLRGLFPKDAVFSASDVPRGKPHPDVFLHAARAMGAKPGACVVVEDTVSGVTAAVAAGMRAIGYAADGDARVLRNAGAEIIRKLEQLPELFLC